MIALQESDTTVLLSVLCLTCISDVGKQCQKSFKYVSYGIRWLQIRLIHTLCEFGRHVLNLGGGGGWG